jgi:hypothetical protein
LKTKKPAIATSTVRRMSRRSGSPAWCVPLASKRAAASAVNPASPLRQYTQLPQRALGVGLQNTQDPQLNRLKKQAMHSKQ